MSSATSPTNASSMPCFSARITAFASAVVRALKQGVEDAFVGDVAEDVRQRLPVNPKALEREMTG